MKKHSGTKKVTCFLDLLQEEEVVGLYKHFTGVTQVKFKDRGAAESALLNASFGKHHPQMIAAFKVAGIHQDTINQFGSMLRGPIAFPEGQMTAKQLKEHARALGEGKKADASRSPADPKQPNQAAAAVLLAIREMFAADPKGEFSSKEVADKLNTNLNAIHTAAESLAKLKYIELEDDSHEEGHKFYWLKLTEEGKDIKVATPSVKLPQSSPGPRSGFDGKFIFKISKTNPRREGTHGWKSWEALRDGMTFEEYKRAGGRNNDLQWDIDKGFAEMRTSKDDAPAKKDLPAKAVKTPPAAPKKSAEAEMAELREKLRAAEERENKRLEANVLKTAAPKKSAPKKSTAKKVAAKKGGKKK